MDLLSVEVRRRRRRRRRRTILSAGSGVRLPGLQEAGIRFRAGNCRPDRGAPIQRQRPAPRTATGLPCHYQTTALALPGQAPTTVRPSGN
ncbi:hypothetical protein BDA96_01G520600 [Sorghum bicolor]|uniref:Uncharacterized protein n=1 Tax=Sorghum bicolor TaxID=4558 RepID=A0A921V1J7_SORBI|nr:hypothetical protein BDA96_01G520600 [Sorghum bicolor]